MYNEIIIDLRQIRKNIHKIRKKTNKKIISVIKADAYGHGSVEVARYIENIVDMFAVCAVEEALQLANSGITKDILVLAQPQYFVSDYPNIIYMVDRLDNIPMHSRVHIAVNSGMNRYGVNNFHDFSLLVESLNASHNSIEGVFTHFYNSNQNDVLNQQERFNSIVKSYAFPRHLIASQNLTLSVQQDFVRVGVAQYCNAKQVVCRVLRIHHIVRGEHIGYDDTIADRDMTIAVLSIGYADGIDRRLKNRWKVRINGSLYRLVGNLCMDCCFAIVDERVRVGDRVYFVDKHNSLSKMATVLNTIDYELMCRIKGDRYKKVFLT